jgi:hypothetical protein
MTKDEGVSEVSHGASLPRLRPTYERPSGARRLHAASHRMQGCCP